VWTYVALEAGQGRLSSDTAGGPENTRAPHYHLGAVLEATAAAGCCCGLVLASWKDGATMFVRQKTMGKGGEEEWVVPQWLELPEKEALTQSH